MLCYLWWINYLYVIYNGPNMYMLSMMDYLCICYLWGPDYVYVIYDGPTMYMFSMMDQLCIRYLWWPRPNYVYILFMAQLCICFFMAQLCIYYLWSRINMHKISRSRRRHIYKKLVQRGEALSLTIDPIISLRIRIRQFMNVTDPSVYKLYNIQVRVVCPNFGHPALTSSLLVYAL